MCPDRPPALSPGPENCRAFLKAEFTGPGTWALEQGPPFSPEESLALQNVPPFVSSNQRYLQRAGHVKDGETSSTQLSPSTECTVPKGRLDRGPR